MHVDTLLLLSINSHPPLVKGAINARLPTLMLVTEQVDFRIKNKYFVYIVKQERNVTRLWHSVFLLSTQKLWQPLRPELTKIALIPKDIHWANVHNGLWIKPCPSLYPKGWASKHFHHYFNVEILKHLVKLTINSKESIKKEIRRKPKHPNKKHILSIQG